MDEAEMMRRVREALGPGRKVAGGPKAPEIAEPIVRLVHTELGLGELFAKRAELNKMQVRLVRPEEVGEALVAFLKEQRCRRIAMGGGRILEDLGVEAAMKAAGLEVRRWGQMTLDELYEVDCGVTDVWCAVAETGSLVMRATAEHGKALSLVPPVHVAIVEPRNCVPDLVDLFEKVAAEASREDVVVITGPSKTADIEANIVTGVHGPGKVGVLVLH